MAKEKSILNAKTDLKGKANPQPLKIFMCTSPFLFGLYYEWASALAGLFLLGYLLYCCRTAGKIIIFKSSLLIAAVVLPAAYGLSSLWAVDSGMALFGMVKYLPLPIFVIAMGQISGEQRKALLDYIPESGAVMTVISGVLSLIPILKDFFTVNSRLAGFFQYPNTFALYLLVGIIILLTKETGVKRKFFILLILSVGIILTGSRTGFLLFAVTVLCFCIILSEKHIRIMLAAMFVLMLAAVGIYVFITGDTASVGRFLTTSFSSSTFLGRLLYFKDALPVILEHPFGLGYMGYYFMQGSFQTGMYSVVNVHNELLQLLLDVGWIPTVLTVWSLIDGVRKGNRQRRMVILVIILHSMFDFNLQFLSIVFILSASVDLNEKKWFEIGNRAFAAGAVIAGCLSLYFGAASGLYYLKQYPFAALLYPGYTNAWMQILTQAEEVNEMEQTADKILVLNPENPLANNAKARAAYSRGDFGSMIEYKRQALEYYRYSLEEYLDYFNMLYVGYQLYMQNSDLNSAGICVEQMEAIPVMMDAVIAETDPLAYRIADKPELELPEEYAEILESLASVR